MQKQALTFLQMNKELVDEYVQTTNQLFLHHGEELLIGTRLFSGMLQKVSENSAKMEQLEKIGVCGDTADFVWNKSFEGLDTALRTNKSHEIMGKTNKMIVDLHYQELRTVCKDPLLIMFDHNGFIVEEQRTELLPA